MPWHFRSALLHEPSPKEAEARREFWSTMRRAVRTRDGKLALAEALLFVIACYTMIWQAGEFVRTGSIQCLFIAALLSAMGFWPFLRHRLRHGDWPA